MDILQKLAIKNLKLNKKITIFTIIGIMLFTATITIVFLMYSSLINYYRIDYLNDYHIIFTNVPVNKINTFQNNKNVEKIFITQYLGRIGQYGKDYYGDAYAYTEDSLTNWNINIKEGRIPKNENEILINCRHIDKEKIGDIIKLYYEEDYGQYHRGKYYDIEKEYNIVGITDEYGPDYVTYLDESNLNGNLELFIKYTKEGLKDKYKITANLLGINEKRVKDISKNNMLYSIYGKNDFIFNDYIIKLEEGKLNNSVAIGGVSTIWKDVTNHNSLTMDLSNNLFIHSLIILLISILCIKNNSRILMYNKTKQYGMLRSIGATKKQIKKIIYYETIILGLISIPLGILFGIFISYILSNVCNLLVEPIFCKKFEFTFSYSAVVIAFLLNFIVQYISALICVKIILKKSPMDLIKKKNEFKIKSKKIKKYKKGNIIFGISSKLALNNLKRNKMQYNTIVLPLVILVILISIFSGKIFYNYDKYKSENDIKNYNIALSFKIQSLNKFIKLTEFNNISDYSIIRYNNIRIDNNRYTNEFLDSLNWSQHFSLNGEISVCSIGEEQYKKYINKIGLDYNKIKNNAILIDNKYFRKPYSTTIDNKVRKFNFNVNDLIKTKIENTDKEFSIIIGAIIEKPALGLEINKDYLLVSDEIFDKYFETDDVKVCFNTNNANQLKSDIEKFLKNEEYDLEYPIENEDAINRVHMLMIIFNYGFIIIITLIVICNIINILIFNLELRKQEFAILKSIGMTKKEIKKMISLEGIIIGLKSIIIGLICSCIILNFELDLWYTIFPDAWYHGDIMFNGNDINRLQYAKEYFEYIIKFIKSIIVIFSIIFLYSKYSLKKIDKQNIIETIRNENI